MPGPAHAAAAAADVQPAIIAQPVEQPKPGLLRGTLRPGPTATFPIDAEIRITARYFDGDPVVIGQTFREVRKWPIRFELQLPRELLRYDRVSIRISACAELDGRTILVTEEQRCYSEGGGRFPESVDLVLVPAVE